MPASAICSGEGFSCGQSMVRNVASRRLTSTYGFILTTGLSFSDPVGISASISPKPSVLSCTHFPDGSKCCVCTTSDALALAYKSTTSLWTSGLSLLFRVSLILFDGTCVVCHRLNIWHVFDLFDRKIDICPMWHIRSVLAVCTETCMPLTLWYESAWNYKLSFC